jgi:hypothetical protein
MYNLESLDYHQLAQLRDEVNQRMLKMRRTTGLRLNELLELLEEVKTTLRDQGKEWRSLERWQYMDGQVCFWLNPADQSRYRMGWFSIDDLIQWSYNIGPIVIEEQEDEDEDLVYISWRETREYDLAA